MVKFMDDSFTYEEDNIRNACLLAPSGHDKATLIQSLLEAAGTAEGSDAADNGSFNIGIHYKMSKKSLESYKGEGDGGFMINLMQSAGHTDIPSEATDALCMADGAIVVTDCAQGSVLHPDGVICHAIRERIRPVMCLTMADSHFLDTQASGEEVYQILSTTIKNANSTVSAFRDKLLLDATVCPEKGTVAFLSNVCCWGFVLRDFANYHSKLIDMDVDLLTRMLWGDHFFDSVTKEWSDKDTETPTCKRGFVKFCYEPIKEIYDLCMANDKYSLLNVLDGYGLVLKETELKLEGEDLLKCVMTLWLPAGATLLNMMVHHLPSPVEAQQYRVENLCRGPLNDSRAFAIRDCDPKGPPVIYVSNMTPGSSGRSSLAFGRVFSGKVEIGMKVRVMGPNHDPDHKDYHTEILQSIEIFVGKKRETVKEVQCGTIIAIVGLKNYIPSNATITTVNMRQAFPLRPISVNLRCDQGLPDIALKATGKSKLRNFQLPYHVYDDLFLHQRDGIMWLWHMHCKKSGGILADDMGLGKTRQVCTFLRGMYHSGLIKRAVIVAPPSLLDPWQQELTDVGIKDAKKYTGVKTEANLNQVVREGGLLCTTYGMFSKIKDSMLGIDVAWDYLFADEGHRAKNEKADVAKSLKKMKCDHKIMITGTPIQNHLKEFHTLMDICNPLLLDEYAAFHTKYVLPINKGKHRDADPDLKRRSIQLTDRLAKVTEPFLLRRTKKSLEGAGQLTSKKYEYTIWIALTSCQAEYYEALVTSDLLRIKGNALTATKLARDICRHPCLLTQNYSTELSNNERQDPVSLKFKNCLFKKYPPHELLEDDRSISSKLDFILYLVKLTIEEQHKVLVFSQSPHMLKIIEKVLGNIMDRKKIIRMDGSTKRQNRTKMRMVFQGELRAKSLENSESSGSGSINSESSGSLSSQSSDLEFSKDCEPQIFLMTTKVGGVGLNLTAASRVIIVDPSENPSDDNQAVDRAYRMGQKQDVIVYRLVTCATIEEHTYREQILKIETSFGVLKEEPCMKSICEKDGLVLSLPPDGFKFCKTHRELVRIYGDEMKIVPSDVGLRHDTVIAASNHSLLFSMKEESKDQKDDYVDDDHKVRHLDKQERRMTETKKVPVTQTHYTKIELTKEAVDRLLAHNSSRLKLLRRATEAVLAIDDNKDMIIYDEDPQELKKASRIVQNFVDEVKSEKRLVIYIPRNRASVVLGNNGDTLKSLMDASQSFIEVIFPERINKDLEGKTVIQIFGDLQKIQRGKKLVLEQLKANGVQYSIKEDG